MKKYEIVTMDMIRIKHGNWHMRRWLVNNGYAVLARKSDDAGQIILEVWIPYGTRG